MPCIHPVMIVIRAIDKTALSEKKIRRMLIEMIAGINRMTEVISSSFIWSLSVEARLILNILNRGSMAVVSIETAVPRW